MIFGLAVGACRWHEREIGSRGRIRVHPEQPRNLVHSLFVFGGKFPARAERLPNQIERREPRLSSGGSIAGIAASASFWSTSSMLNCARTSDLNDRQRHVTVRPANPTHRLEARSSTEARAMPT